MLLIHFVNHLKTTIKLTISVEDLLLLKILNYYNSRFMLNRRYFKISYWKFC